MQFLQEDCFFRSPMVPGRQSRQLTAPTSDMYVPSVHSVHLSFPGAVWCCPSSHVMHSFNPVVGPLRPGLHSRLQEKKIEKNKRDEKVSSILWILMHVSHTHIVFKKE